MLSLKLLLQVVVPVLLLAGAFLIGRLFAAQMPSASNRTLHAGLSIDRLGEVSELLVTQVDVTDVVVTSLRGKTGGVEIVLLVKGDVSLGVDVAAAQFADIDHNHRTAVLTLPPPKPSRPRLDHSRTRIVLMRKEGLWQVSLGSRAYAVAADRAMAEAQAFIVTAGSSAEADRRARAHAETVLRAFFKSINWKVEVRWSDSAAVLSPTGPN